VDYFLNTVSYSLLEGNPEGKRPLGRPRRRWNQNGSLGDWLGVVLSGFSWLNIETSGWLLLTR
jgi:hypothetical protein